MRQPAAKWLLLLLIPLIAVSQDVPFPREGGRRRFPQQDEPMNGREEFRRRNPLQRGVPTKVLIVCPKEGCGSGGVG